MISIPGEGKENAGSLDKITNMEFQIILVENYIEDFSGAKKGVPKLSANL